MSIFKKTIKHSKPSNNLDKKIKTLEEGLKKTKVVSEDGMLPSIPKISDEFVVEEKENELYNWRESFLQEILTDEILDDNLEVGEKNNLVRVERYISKSNQELINLRNQIFEEISEDTLLNLPEIKNKISKVLQIYDKLQEGLLNEPPQVKNEDPLTPLDQNFVTIEELNKHYTLFINRIQEQLATLGGGGETRLQYLDDIVGIATNASVYNGKFLQYNHSIKKFEFVAVSGGGGGDYAAVAGISTVAEYALVSGVSTYSDYASVAGISTVAEYALVSGISTVSEGLTGTPNITVATVNAGSITASNIFASGISTFVGLSSFRNNVNFLNDNRLYFGDDNGVEIYSNGSSGVYRQSNFGTTYHLGSNFQFADPDANVTYAVFSGQNVAFNCFNQSLLTLNSSGVSIASTTAVRELRTKSVAEKTTIIDGNTVDLAFSSGGGNVAICVNPSGDITLNVNEIPTDDTFDNHSVSFSIIVTQTGTARTCTAVNLNGVSKTIQWSGGSLANALSGVSTTNGYDIFTFTGINTVGSASTTDNYVVLGTVKGGFA